MTDNKESKAINVFMIMPFSEDHLALYEELKSKFKGRYVFSNAGDLDTQQNILEDIVKGICSADAIIADVTGLNANVFYELGLAHAMNKKVIIITQDIGSLPFDIKPYRANQYSLLFYKMPQLVDTIGKLLDGAIDNTIQYGNPISDFAPKYYKDLFKGNGTTEKETTVSNSDEIVVEVDLSDDKGALDYIAEIQNGSNAIETEFVAIGDGMQHIIDEIERTTADVNKTNNDNMDMNYVRRICRKIAKPIDEYTLVFPAQIAKISSEWSAIENSLLSLFDNDYTIKSGLIPELRKSVDELDNIQQSIGESNNQIEELIEALRSGRGLERKLNKAIDTLISQLEEYMLTMETISASIDRIKSKSDNSFSLLS